jgi:Family of unknown function (DUF5684)
VSDVIQNLISLLLWGIVIVSTWKIYQKAGQPGWASIIPFYNYIVGLRIVGRPWWWLLLLLVPVVNVVIFIVLALDLAKSFGKGTGFGIGLILLWFIFLPILAFGSDHYVGPRGGPSGEVGVAPAISM